MNTLMTIKQVCATTSLSRTTIWRLQQRGEFPKGVKLSESRIAYRSTEIEQWISNRLSH